MIDVRYQNHKSFSVVIHFQRWFDSIHSEPSIIGMALLIQCNFPLEPCSNIRYLSGLYWVCIVFAVHKRWVCQYELNCIICIWIHELCYWMLCCVAFCVSVCVCVWMSLCEVMCHNCILQAAARRVCTLIDSVMNSVPGSHNYALIACIMEQ